MKALNKKIAIMMICWIECLFTSCKPNVHFNEQDLILTKPFQTLDTIVFTSLNAKNDTIVFFSAKVDTISYRNLEQGYYDQYILRVNYVVLPGSYHKITVDKFNNPEEFYSCAVSDISTRELGFLGLLFEEEIFIDLPHNDDEGVILFEGTRAKYMGVNINEGISSFKFSPQIGVISYVDTSGVEWTRNADY